MISAQSERLSMRAARERGAAWKAEALRIGREEDHSREVLLSLFDASGAWSQPYVDAGYRVLRFDLTRGQDLMAHLPVEVILRLRDEGHTFAGVLAAMPCTSFAVSGARWWKDQHDVRDAALVERKYGSFAAEFHESPLEAALTLVRVSEVIVELAAPGFHAFENPIGRMRAVAELPAPRLTFDPCDYGDPYTKRTQLFGDFNPALPTARVTPELGSMMHRLRGDVPEQKALRSQTPLGFSYAFFMANHGTEARA